MACSQNTESPYNPGWFYTGAVAANGGCIMVQGGTAYSGSATIISRTAGPSGGIVKPTNTQRNQAKTSRENFAVENPTNRLLSPYSPSGANTRLLTVYNMPEGGPIEWDPNKPLAKKPCGCSGSNGGSKRAQAIKRFALTTGIGVGFLILLFGLVGMFPGSKK